MKIALEPFHEPQGLVRDRAIESSKLMLKRVTQELTL